MKRGSSKVYNLAKTLLSNKVPTATIASVVGRSKSWVYMVSRTKNQDELSRLYHHKYEKQEKPAEVEPEQPVTPETTPDEPVQTVSETEVGEEQETCGTNERMAAALERIADSLDKLADLASLFVR